PPRRRPGGNAIPRRRLSEPVQRTARPGGAGFAPAASWRRLLACDFSLHWQAGSLPHGELTLGRLVACPTASSSMPKQIYISGQLVPPEEAKVSVFDHGLLYGDGVFEGLRCYGGKVFRLEEHVARLYESARAILLEIPLSPKQMAEAINNTVAANGLSDGYIRAVV